MNANLQITRHMSLNEKIRVQIEIARSWGKIWTRQQAANQLWFIGWITDAELRAIAG